MTDRLDHSPFGADLWEALGRYVAGESTPAEADQVRRWLAEGQGREELVAALRRSIQSVEFSPPRDLNVEAALQRVHGRLGEPEVLPINAARRRTTFRALSVGLRAAAGVALVAGAAFLWRISGPGAPVAAAGPSYSTTIGRTDSVRLPDGTLAVLAPASRLDVAGDFGKDVRSVDLTGEAVFQVVHDAAHPFRVRTTRAIVEDLGTTFIVRSDESDDVQVVVTEGSVLLQGRDDRQGASKSKPAPATSSNQSGGVVLKAGDRGTVGPDGRPVAERSVATADDLAWTRGRLLFENAPLSRVRSDLRRWYGVELRVDSTLASRHLTASFAGEPVGQVLDVIALALGARLERRGDTAFVRSR